ncbi:hypothetical protein RI845_12165 [Thalassotalea nanhaiensis]|uniref:WD40 repeat domain-containing protein n=1 Tax=Thalassotalea nanhaiensis TaxID=3065648 RepID=A0ABY9TG82_9GAMM|nr:hypothetical protein RI845_12165 [Colwelliaceae bacterium SQ345]
MILNSPYTKSHFLKSLFTILSINLFSSAAFAEDEVYVAEIKDNKLVSIENISQRQGYDNQPHFTADSNSLLFTAMYEVKGADGKATQQTDSLHFDLTTKKTSNLTSSAASEYSPTITPDGKHFSVIRVGDDGKQLLWQYPYSPQETKNELVGESLIPSVFDVGYHVWLNSDELLLFVLGDPMTLQRVQLSTGKTQPVDINIGRTLRKVPNENLYSYTKADGKQWQLKLYNPADKTVETSVTLPANNMYYAWHQSGALLSADKAIVMKNELDEEGKWQPFLDFSSNCKGDITRMVMSENSVYLAFVCATK